MATEQVKKTPPPSAPGKVAALVKKAMAVKMPGNVPLPVFLGVFFGVFFIVTAVMAYVSLNHIVRVRKQHMLSLPVAPGPGKAAPSPAGLLAAVTVSTAVPSSVRAPRETTPPAPVPATSGSEMDNRVVNFLLHSYEEQKAQLASQEKKIARLENALTAAGNKASAVPVATSPLRQTKKKNTLPAAFTAPAAVAPSVPKRAVAAPQKKTQVSPARVSSDVKRLAELYTQMKPADVSSIIEDLDDDTLVKVFACMKPRNVAKILSLLDPQRAARISKKIAN